MYSDWLQYSAYSAGVWVQKVSRFFICQKRMFPNCLHATLCWTHPLDWPDRKWQSCLDRHLFFTFYNFFNGEMQTIETTSTLMPLRHFHYGTNKVFIKCVKSLLFHTQIVLTATILQFSLLLSVNTLCAIKDSKCWVFSTEVHNISGFLEQEF